MKNLSTYNSFILEATYSTDKLFADKAELLYETVYELLKNKEYEKSRDTFIIYGKNISSEYLDLIIFFMHPTHPLLANAKIDNTTEVRYSKGSTKDGRYQVIVCGNLIKPGDDTYIESRLSKHKFIHEAIHYFDERRYKSKSVKGSAHQLNQADYYNNPMEFNANYHEASYQLKNMMKQEFLRNKFLTDFDTFKTFATRMFYKDFINIINDTYKQKLYKRLYTLYNALLLTYQESVNKEDAQY